MGYYVCYLALEVSTARLLAYESCTGKSLVEFELTSITMFLILI